MPRPNAPWWRTDRRQWFATIRGKKVPLNIHDPADVRGAIEALGRLLNPQARPTLSPATDECYAGVSSCDSPGAGENRPPVGRTVAELVPVYEAEVVSQVAPVTRASYKSRLVWFRGRFGGRAVAEVGPGEVEREAKGKWPNANTRRHVLLVCQHFMKWAGRKDFFLKKPPPESRGDDTLIRPDQFAELLRHCRGDFGPYLRFLWLTGCRPGEACNLTADQVDWLGGTCVLKKHKTAYKGKRRVIYLSPEAFALLREQRERHGGGHLFRGRCSKPFNPVGVQVRFRRLVGKTGIARTAYCLRHSYITRMLEMGKSDSDVAALVGHAGTAVIHRTYSHLTANARRLREVAAGGDG